MVGIGVGVQQANGDAFDLLAFDFRDQGLHRPLIQRNQYGAAPVHAFGDRQAKVARHQRRRTMGVEVILVEPVLEGYFQRIPMALGHDERGLGALLLDQRIGRQGGSMNDQLDIAWLSPRRFKHLHSGGQEALRRKCRRGQQLFGRIDAVFLEHGVGEGAADIDG